MNCKSSIILLLGITTFMDSVQGKGTGGSKCEGTNCTPAPGGTTCEAKYDRDDGCCPVWHCANGQSVYGKSTSTSSFSGTSTSFSFGTPPLAGGGFPGFPGLPGMGMGGNRGLPGMGGGFPFFGRR